MRGRPKAADYDMETRAILQTAIQVYCSTLLTQNPYPSAVQGEQWAVSAWKIARMHHTLDKDHTTCLMKLVTARTSHIRSQFKSRARSIVKTTYGFESGQDEAVLLKNRALSAELKTESAFIYRTRGSCIDEHTGIYANPAIQQVINEVLFKNGNDDGPRWSKYYSSFPHSAFALTLTAIECAIDEWATGVRQTIAFTEEEYVNAYVGHDEALDEFDKATSEYKLLSMILKRVFDN
ncbi:hypothetical protein EV363DRAFT_1405391 [Boletus edulis]|nr:hypothetical protein EV363DRAFT_1405391 [Boletus edulis]